MRKFTMLFALLFVCGLSYAQDTIRVAPNYTTGGALNKAIADNGPNKVYLLEVNGFYTLTATIEFLRPADDPNAWYHIVGEKPKQDGDFMPVIQTGINAANNPFDNMFLLRADVSFKDVFLVNQTVTGQLGRNTFLLRSNVRLEVDGCVVDPVGRTDFVQSGDPGRGSSVFVTNSLILRQGDPFSPNGGHVFRDVWGDTLFIENNTFVSTDNGLIASPDKEQVKQMDFVWFNHNTVVFHDVSIIGNFYMPKTYITNNLFYDLTTYVQQHAWAVLDPDFGLAGTYPSLAKADTTFIDGVYETLPSTRTQFWNGNALFVSNAVRDSILAVPVNNAEANHLFQFPVIWNEDVPHYFVTDWAAKGEAILAASREDKIFNDNTNWPNFKEANTYYDTNPDFVDPRIEEFSKDVASSALFWYRLNKLLPGTNPSVQKSQFWDVDAWAGTSAAMYPTVWPRWNGAYTNPTLLTASNAGLPLGDLNAFPEAKARWEAEKENIMAHILSLSTEKYSMVNVDEATLRASEKLSVYPNPVNNMVTIEGESILKSIKIYNIAGQLVRSQEVNDNRVEMDLSGLVKGMYILNAEDNDGRISASKLIKN